jgi:hypothetical protein
MFGNFFLTSKCQKKKFSFLAENLEEYNRHYNYILTAIDYFSRKVWARPLKNKEAETIRNALESIFTEMTITPHILQSDNGREFKNYNSINCLKDKILNRYLHYHMRQNLMG